MAKSATKQKREKRVGRNKKIGYKKGRKLPTTTLSSPLLLHYAYTPPSYARVCCRGLGLMIAIADEAAAARGAD